MPPDHVLAIDQGTTSTRAILFDRAASPVATAQRPLPQHHPAPGWVEHDAEEIWRDVLWCVREVLGRAEPGRIAAIGLTNQRETCLLWDRATGEAIGRAIVWQDRRTADRCAELKGAGWEPLVRERTGLLLDPYFSATKAAWLLDHVPGARTKAERGELAFGTVDSFLLWRLTDGKLHATDVTNASRTLLYDIGRGCWDEELCRLFGVPASVLPEVRDSSGAFGITDAGLFGREVPIAGVAGDQQAALVGQACFSPGMAKATFGTGGFLLLNTGERPAETADRLLTTIAYSAGGRTDYAVEGSIFVAGAAIGWLRDRVGAIGDAGQVEAMAQSLPSNGGVYLVPAFAGLGAPHWDPEARGAIHGLTLDSGAAHLVRAALEAVAYQTHDLFAAMSQDGGPAPATLRIDGGMAANGWLCQFLADILQVPVERPDNLETTAVGAAFLAGLACGVWSDFNALRSAWRRRDRFEPRMKEDQRARLLAGWHDAVTRTLRSSKSG